VPVDENYWLPTDEHFWPHTLVGWRAFITYRMAGNLATTGHPLHHRTIDMTIVDSDPTLEHAMLQAGPGGVPPVLAFVACRAKPSVPVDLDHNGFDLVHAG